MLQCDWICVLYTTGWLYLCMVEYCRVTLFVYGTYTTGWLYLCMVEYYRVTLFVYGIYTTAWLYLCMVVYYRVTLFVYGTYPTGKYTTRWLYLCMVVYYRVTLFSCLFAYTANRFGPSHFGRCVCLYGSMNMHVERGHWKDSRHTQCTICVIDTYWWHTLHVLKGLSSHPMHHMCDWHILMTYTLCVSSHVLTCLTTRTLCVFSYVIHMCDWHILMTYTSCVSSHVLWHALSMSFHINWHICGWPAYMGKFVGNLWGIRYRVANTHRIPYLYRSFSAKVTYI